MHGSTQKAWQQLNSTACCTLLTTHLNCTDYHEIADNVPVLFGEYFRSSKRTYLPLAVMLLMFAAAVGLLIGWATR